LSSSLSLIEVIPIRGYHRRLNHFPHAYNEYSLLGVHASSPSRPSLPSLPRAIPLSLSTSSFPVRFTPSRARTHTYTRPLTYTYASLTPPTYVLPQCSTTFPRRRPAGKGRNADRAVGGDGEGEGEGDGIGGGVLEMVFRSHWGSLWRVELLFGIETLKPK